MFPGYELYLDGNVEDLVEEEQRQRASIRVLKAVGLLVFLAVNPAQASSVTSEDIVSRVVKVLRDFQDQPAIVERALTALSVTSGVPSLLVSKGVVPLALAAIKKRKNHQAASNHPGKDPPEKHPPSAIGTDAMHAEPTTD